MPHRSDGFTLIELAIVIAIAGLTTGGAIYGVTAMRENNEQRETELAMRAADRALTLYVRRHERLPCPDTTASNDGEDDDDSGGACTATLGLLPWKTLGLTRAQGNDGWNNRLTYGVDPALTVETSDPDEPPMPLACDLTDWNMTNRQAILDVEDPSGLGTGPSRRHAAYVLISHGGNGLGAVIASGGGNPAAGGAAEQANHNHGSSGGNTFYAVADETDFDDLLSYRSPGKLLADTGCRLTMQGDETDGSGGGGNGGGDDGGGDGEEPPEDPPPAGPPDIDVDFASVGFETNGNSGNIRSVPGMSGTGDQIHHTMTLDSQGLTDDASDDVSITASPASGATGVLSYDEDTGTIGVKPGNDKKGKLHDGDTLVFSMTAPYTSYTLTFVDLDSDESIQVRAYDSDWNELGRVNHQGSGDSPITLEGSFANAFDILWVNFNGGNKDSTGLRGFSLGND